MPKETASPLAPVLSEHERILITRCRPKFPTGYGLTFPTDAEWRAIFDQLEEERFVPWDEGRAEIHYTSSSELVIAPTGARVRR